MWHVSRLRSYVLTVTATLAVLCTPIVLTAQPTHPLATRLASQMAAVEENNFLLQMERTTPAAHKERATALALEGREIAGQMRTQPRDVQALIRQQSNSLLQVRMVPLREQWKQQLAEKAKADQARDTQRRADLTADAEAAGKLQAARTLIRERLQRNEITQAEAARADQAAEQQVLALQRKYDSYGVSSRTNWGTLFSQSMARYASTSVADARLRERLDDTQSEIGRDAHRAADLNLTMQRNQIFVAQRALSAPEAQALNTTAQQELTAIQAKYGPTVAAASDFTDRYTRLVQAGTAAQRQTWEREALVARDAAAARVAVEQQAAAEQARADAAARQAAAPPPAAPAAQTSSSAQRTGGLRPPALPAPSGPAAPMARVRGERTLSWRPIILLLVLGGGGAGYVMYRGRRRVKPATFSDVKERYAPVPTTSATGRVTAPSSPPPPLALPHDTSVKDRLLAEQRQKYQVRYSEAMDAMTQASMAVSEMAPVLQAVHENLQKLSKSLQTQVAALVMARTGSTRSILIRAATLWPLVTLFRRFGLLLKIVLVVVVWWTVTTALRLIAEGEIASVLLPYLIVVGALFLVERHLRLKVPLSALKKHADEFKDMKLAYIYTDQLPHMNAEGGAQLHAIRVRATEKKAAADEFAVPTGGDITVGQGGFLLGIGSLGTYRIDPTGSVKLLASGGKDFMDAHGDLLTEALGEQGSFAAATLPALADYGQVMWRRKQATDDVPRLEALVKDVDRLQKLWQETCVSDQVFEFLFRRIDMFNMRDSATPAGILLFGAPGNGRAHLAKKIAESISAKFQQINPSKLKSAEEITALWEQSRSGEARVLFVANADTAFKRDGDSSREALEFIAEWEKHHPSESRVWVVMAAESDQTVEKAIVRQIGKNSKIEITPPDAAGRETILRQACRTHQITADVPAFVITSTGGASVSDLYEIVEAVKQESTLYQPEEKHWKAAVKAVRGADAKIKDERKTWERLVLPDTIKDQLKAACKVLQNAPEYLKRGVEVPNILLYGPPGTGKTEIARTIANEGGVNFLETNLATFKADHIGGSGQAVRAKFAEARAMAPAVLFIDEIDGIASQRGSEGEDKFTKEIVTQLLSETDGTASPDRPVFVLAATNHLDHIDRAVLSRFGNKIQIPPPDEVGRKEILKRVLRERPLDPAADLEQVSAAIAKLTPGMAGRDLLMLVRKAASQAALTADAEHVVITEALLMEIARDAVKNASDAVDESARWDSLVVSDQTMAKLKQISTALRNMEARLKQGIEPSRGAILFGPPGTGKTQIAKTLANESGVRVLLKDPSDLKKSHLGSSGQAVRLLFDEARSVAPCILFIDEFDSIAAPRGGPNGVLNDEMVTEFLVQTEGAKKGGKPVFVLAATNHLDKIDSAVLSRLNDKIEIPLPTAEQRERLFNVFLSKCRNVDFDRAEMAAVLAQRAGDIGGRDIRNLIANATQEAASRAEEHGTPEHIVLSRTDLLKQFAPKGEQLSDEEIRAVWKEIVLKPEVKDSLLEMIRLFNRGDKLAARGLLLYGPPGTGKTEIARKMAKSTGCKFLEVKPSDLKAGSVGQSGQQVKAVWDRARGYGRCVMFVDECDGVFARRGGVDTDSFNDDVVNSFLQEWDGVGSTGQIWVVGATNRRDRFDDAIISRFGTPIEIGLPDAAQRVEILRLEMKKLERDVAVPDFVGPATTGFAGRKLAELAKTVCMRGEKGGGVNDEVWREVIGASAKATSSAVDETASWDSLILQEPTVRRLKSICQMLKNAEMLRAQKVDVPRAALLFGPPGTGKTQVARTLANESGLAFIAAGPSDLKAGYTGQSGQLVRTLFERARGAAPCILFIDEIESGAAAREGGRTDQFTGEIVNELLTQMDGVKKATGDVFVLAATNHPNHVDTAVLSRFGERIEIPNPGLEERLRMIKTFIGERRVDFDVDHTASELAAMTEGMSGRDLTKLVSRASQQSLQRAMDAGDMSNIVMSRDDLVGQLSSSAR